MTDGGGCCCGVILTAVAIVLLLLLLLGGGSAPSESGTEQVALITEDYDIFRKVNVDSKRAS